MARMQVDASELRRLQMDLGSAPERAYEQTRKVTQRAALNIKRDMQEEATGVSESFARVAASISYETWESRDGVEAVIGPEFGHERGHHRAQGSLAWIAYEGTARTAPVFPDPAGALDREADAFRTYLARAVVGDML
jgi:uncharacterized protein (DUF58 family)